MRIVTIASFIFCSLTFSAQEVWSLEKCINYAIENNLQIKQNEVNLAFVEFSRTQTIYDFLPTLNAGASHGYNWGQRIDPFTNEFASERIRNNSFFLSSQVDLFNGFTKWHARNQAEVNLEVTKLEIENTKNDIILNIAAAYLNVLQTNELWNISKNSIGATQLQVDRMQKLVDAGQVAIGNLYDLQAQLASEELNVIQNENAFILAKLTLAQLMQIPSNQANGFQIEVPNFDDMEVNMPAADVDVLYTSAQSNLPDIALAEKGIESTELGLKVAKAAMMPSLSASGSLGTGYSGNAQTVIGDPDLVPVTIGVVDGTTNTVSTIVEQFSDDDFATKSFQDQWEDNFNQSLTLSLNIPIFNGLSIRTGIKQQEVNLESQKIALELAKNTLYQEVQQAYTNAIAAYKEYQSTEKSLNAFELNYTNAEKRFEQQVINPVDFNDARTRFLNAQTQLVLSKYNFVFQTKILDFYQGKEIKL
ncbi:MAG: TolC family protein [Bacteroidota bacterium]